MKFAVQQDFVYICVYYTSREFPIIPHVNFPYKTSMDDLEFNVAKSCASVDNHIPLDDIFDYHPIRECNIYHIIPNIRSFIFYRLRPTMLRGVPKGK